MAKSSKRTSGVPAPRLRPYPVALTPEVAFDELSARERVEAAGLDYICTMLAAGEMLTDIAAELGVSRFTLTAWMNSDFNRSARAREARRLGAAMWDEKAEVELRKARTPLAMARARELAHHYRWRAAKLSPREYGDRLAPAGGTDVRALSDEELHTMVAAYGFAPIGSER